MANIKASEPALQPSVVRFLRRREVCALTGLSTSTLYEMMRDGTFVRPIRIARRLVVWQESDIAAWQAAQIAASKMGAAK